MKIKLENFENVLRKATINFGIETVQLRFENGRIKSDMVSNDKRSISILNIPNNVMDRDEDLVFNFNEPNQSVLPFIRTQFEQEEVAASITDAFLTLKEEGPRESSCRLVFCDAAIVKRLGKESIKSTVDFFFTIQIDKDIVAHFERLKKVGSRFGKIYLEIKNNKAYLVTSDKTNMYSNDSKFLLGEVEHADLDLAFSFKDVVNLFTIVTLEDEWEEKGFAASFTYLAEQELGMMHVVNGDESEQYCLLSTEL
jgi:hypothetical protein